jgi:hypothetical protein
MFSDLNRDEKILIRELINRQDEVKNKENQFKIANVVSQQRIGRL